MITLLGLRIIESPYAIQVREYCAVEPWPIKKRRRNWTIRRHRIEKPAMLRTSDGVVIVHPTLMAQLRKLT